MWKFAEGNYQLIPGVTNAVDVDDLHPEEITDEMGGPGPSLKFTDWHGWVFTKPDGSKEQLD